MLILKSIIFYISLVIWTVLMGIVCLPFLPYSTKAAANYQMLPKFLKISREKLLRRDQDGLAVHPSSNMLPILEM